MEVTKNYLFPPLYLESEGGAIVCCDAVQVITVVSATVTLGFKHITANNIRVTNERDNVIGI